MLRFRRTPVQTLDVQAINEAQLAAQADALLAEATPEQLETLYEAVFPAGVVDTLGPATIPRKGKWHTPCPICGLVLSGTDVIVPVLMSDGSRPYIHKAHLETRPDGDADCCKHGIVPASACVWCSGKELALYPRGRSFRCKRAGKCIVCDTGFKPGTLIQQVSCAKGVGYAHAWHVA